MLPFVFQIVLVLSAALACGALPSSRLPDAFADFSPPIGAPLPEPRDSIVSDLVSGQLDLMHDGHGHQETPNDLPTQSLPKKGTRNTQPEPGDTDHALLVTPSVRSLLPLSAQPSSPQRLRICCVVHQDLLAITMFIATWANANKARFLARGVNVTARVIGTPEPMSWSTKAARAVVRETDNCDVFFGTAASSVALVGSVVVSKIWLDSAASATLSDKEQYPFYNRMYLDSRQDGEVVASMITGLGVTSVHTLCTDESYGRSALDGFAARAAAPDARFTVASRQCILATASKAEVMANVSQLRKHTSHWVYLAIALPHYPLIYAALNDAGLNQTLTFFAARCVGVAYPSRPGCR